MTKNNKIPELPYSYRKKFSTDNLSSILVEDNYKQYEYKLNNTKVLTREEEQYLFKRYKDYGCKESFDIIYYNNLKLVFRLAYKYSYLDVDLIDIIQEGNLGLFRAIEHFDYCLGYKLSTYSQFWIEQAINRAFVIRNNNLEIPDYIQDMLVRVKRFKSDFVLLFDREPTLTEISFSIYDVNVPELKIYLCANAEIAYLDKEYAGTDFKGDKLSDIIIDRLGVDPVVSSINTNAKELLQDFYRSIDERERYIMEHRYSLDSDNDNMTLEEIGNILCITRERVRQIESTCIVKAEKYLNSRGFFYFDMIL